MALYNWEKVPASEIPRIKNALEANDLSDLLKVYNEYSLGPFPFCCPHQEMAYHFQTAIEEEKIR